jgi:hypothetical protein
MRMAIDGETLRAVSLPVIAGLLVRAIPVVTADFPLNDGGLFFAMSRDLQNANFLLPATASYNGLGIPFAYPPLGFYLAGLLSTLFSVGLFDVFRFLPLILATLTIPVVYLVSREILATRFQALLATWAFAFLPRAFDWLILGGGLTRALGLLFAFLAILEGIRFYKTGQRRHAGGLAVFAALTALSHPEAALFTGLSMLLMLAAYGRTWRALRDSIVLAVISAILAAPWWASVIAAHGLAPFLSGGQTGVDLASSFHHLVTFTFTDEPYGTPLAVIGLIGLVHQVVARRYLLPAWVVFVFAIDPRGAATELMLPIAMLIAIAIDEVFLAPVARSSSGSDAGMAWPREVIRDRRAQAFLAVVLILGVIGGARASTYLSSPLHPLPGSNRAAMAWIAVNAPSDAAFVVVTGEPWFIDATSEWFPVLTGHRSLATVQGYEWLGKSAFDNQLNRHYQAQLCIWIGPSCIQDWIDRGGEARPWLYLPEQTIFTFSPTDDCCGALRAGLVSSPNYQVVYSGPGGDVLKPSQ